MDALIHRLQQKLQEHPRHPALTDAIATLQALKERKTGNTAFLESLEHKLRILREQEIWAPTPDEEIILAELLQTSPNSATPRLTAHPGQSTPRLPFSFATPTALPMELYGILNQAYYLHLLATEPDTVLPPGKSLLSTLSKPHADRQAPSVLHERVEDLVHRAFWDEALQSLSNPSPPVQLTRLKRLYEDLHLALSPLLPKSHPVLVTLSSPLSPTSAPLRSASIHLREVLQSLKQRCAPSRDGQLDALVRTLQDPSDSALPQTIVDAIRSMLKLAEEMKDDLSQFVLGTMSEQQLRDVITTEAASRERELVLQMWRPEVLRDRWRHWLEESGYPESDATITDLPHRRFIRRVMTALGTNEAVSCNLPAVTVHMSPTGSLEPEPSADTSPVPPNSLPPPLLFTTPALFYIQNHLQALVIAAALRALVRIPTTPLKRKLDAGEDAYSEHSFMRRVWALLRGEVDSEPAADGLKLVNLADEVVRISQAHGCTLHANGTDKNGADTKSAEARLREAVDRTLKPGDPVFQLLQKRLVDAIATHLISHAPVRPQAAPEMHAGRVPPGAKGRKPKLVLDKNEGVHRQLEFARETLSVKGFEHPVLADAVSDAVLRLRKCIAWTELVWADLFAQP
ncbi:hypothetical protein PsYK624_120480 [Phanerochaete sordida]|uniref:Uncharacterized protein n=1 Tax=Phanerochaete sordida TaxID=48140 RepID=A0A9P3GHS9_9APHY|nr:hypothetical protein PsYK624_120480 [Phanerochaete sordida]